jgi:hypothetical protein
MIARLIVGTIREEPGSLEFESQRLNRFDKMSLVQLDWRSHAVYLSGVRLSMLTEVLLTRFNGSVRYAPASYRAFAD